MSGAPVIRKRTVPSLRRRDGLLRYARNVTSQNGEDGILARLLELLPSNIVETRFCVDVGAWDGKHMSNTYSLLVQQEGWKGVLVEADPERFDELKALHEPHGNICINVAVSCEENSPYSLVNLLKDRAPELPRKFDVLSIDVDGADYWLLHDLLQSELYRPMVICVEFNPTMPHDLIYIPPRTDVMRHGASLAALYELADSYDYVLVETTLYNAFFVPRDLYDKYLSEEAPDTSIEALHETTMGTSLYQLYDGTLKLWGCRKLLWHRLPIDEDSIQVLPPGERNFPFAPQQAESSKDQELHDMAIDMSPYCVDLASTECRRREECVDALWTQLQKDGFALVRGTGMSRQLCQAALDATNTFLQQADESVRRSCLAKDRARRGYSAMCTENFASLIGAIGPNDLVRKFRVGPVTTCGKDTIRESSPLLQSNIWPQGWNEAESFQSVVEEYYEASRVAANAIVRAICDGILLEHPRLEDSVQALSMESTSSVAHTSILTLLSYQPGTRHRRKDKPPLVAPHTDVGVITFLLFDDGACAKLQRSDREKKGDWLDVTLPVHLGEDPVFVVNIGDCLSELSDGSLPSTLHRVVPCTETLTPRNCLALFVGLDPDHELTMPDGQKLSYEEWRRQRIARAQAVLRATNDSSQARN